MGDVRYQFPILQSSFPAVWSELPTRQLAGATPPRGPSPYSSMMAAIPDGGIGGWDYNAAMLHWDRLAHINPTIQAALREYHTKFTGRVMVQGLLEQANLTFCDLPFLATLVDSQTGKNWLCYNHCLGICQHGRQCIFKRCNGHVDGANLPGEFAVALAKKLKPGIAFMLRS